MQPRAAGNPPSWPRATARGGPAPAALVHAAALAVATAWFAAILVAWLTGGASAICRGPPALGLRLSFAVDGLGALFGILLAGDGGGSGG